MGNHIFIALTLQQLPENLLFGQFLYSLPLTAPSILIWVHIFLIRKLTDDTHIHTQTECVFLPEKVLPRTAPEVEGRVQHLAILTMVCLIGLFPRGGWGCLLASLMIALAGRFASGEGPQAV